VSKRCIQRLLRGVHSILGMREYMPSGRQTRPPDLRANLV
jgi:hypothetical protein